MITYLYCDLADKLKDSGYFESVYEYTEIINGSAYIRKRGNVSMQIDRTATRLTSCSDTIQMVTATIPLRLVVAVPKTQLEDSPLVDDILAADLIGVLQSDMQATATAMDATSVICAVSGYDTDSVTIWEAENKGVALDETKVYRFAYLAIDFICEIRGDVQCLQNCLKNEY